MSGRMPGMLAMRLAAALGPDAACDLADQLERQGLSARVLALLDELHEVSAKVEASALAALPELERRSGLTHLVAWLDLGVALAGSSGAAALKYFKESPLVLERLEATSRAAVLSLALDLVDDDVNVAFEVFRCSPDWLAVLPACSLRAWATLGVELATVNYVLGIEFVRQVPAVARVLTLEQVRPWIAFGMKLVVPNSLGKTDYLGTLEFFRSSPGLLAHFDTQALRIGVLEVGSAMADHSPPLALAFLAEAPGLLRRLPSDEWRTTVLRSAVQVAKRDAEAATQYLHRCQEIIALLGEGACLEEEAGRTFQRWFESGLEVLALSIEAGRAYFALETKQALASFEQASCGVPLRQVARTLQLFAQALCGTEVSIGPLPEMEDPNHEHRRAMVSPDGRTILLPAFLRRYPTREANLRLYIVMTAHEAGHLAYGTYTIPMAHLEDLIAEVRRRYGHRTSDGGERLANDSESGLPRVQISSSASSSSISTLGALFALYPEPRLMRDLWTVLEDARVEQHLRQTYPGLAVDLARQAEEAVRTHSLTEGLTVRELVADALLLLFSTTPGTVRIPEAISEVVQQAWTIGQAVLDPGATAADAVRIADRIYVLMDELLSPVSLRQDTQDQEPSRELVSHSRLDASRAQPDSYQSVTNWVYRGVMNPDQVQIQHHGTSHTNWLVAGQECSPTSGAGGGPLRDHPSTWPSVSHRMLGNQPPGVGVEPNSSAFDFVSVGDSQCERVPHGPVVEQRYLYDEWDGSIRDYRSRWCCVLEQAAPEATSDFAECTLAAYGPVVRGIRRYFDSLRPQAFLRMHGEAYGDELDVDAVVRRATDRIAGAEPSERIYLRRDKRERSVAVAFLVDLSGSTSRQLGVGAQRVIDIEKESLVLLCEALEAVGDQYALYGYSGRGRAQVEFMVLKEFDEHDRNRVARRIGALTPLNQNRDGAAIRHATAKLLRREARIRLLVLLSDGRPLDEDYAGEYALEDTKCALREARAAGVHPFCVTVDRSADDYLTRMYGEVAFVVIDRVAVLPEQLPRLYARLTR